MVYIHEWSPTRSVLGPVLFLIYVNELPTLSESRIKLFVDDAKKNGVMATPQNAEQLQTIGFECFRKVV